MSSRCVERESEVWNSLFRQHLVQVTAEPSLDSPSRKQLATVPFRSAPSAP